MDDPLQPWEYEAELLGGLIAFPGLVADIRRIVTPDDLDIPRHGRIYRLIETLPGGIGPILDHLAALDHEGREHLGGVAYVLALPMRVSIPELVEPLALRLRADAIRRQTERTAQNILIDIEAGEPIADIIRTAERALTGIRWRLSSPAPAAPSAQATADRPSAPQAPAYPYPAQPTATKPTPNPSKDHA